MDTLHYNSYSNIIWASWRLLSQTSRRFFNNLFQDSIELKASKLRINGSLLWESASDRWVPLTKGQ